MRIFFLFTGNGVDSIIESSCPNVTSFTNLINSFASNGSCSMMGYVKNSSDHFLTFANSQIIQKKWCEENNFESNWNDGQFRILDKQIQYFKPDVIYTVNPTYLSTYIQNSELNHKCILSFWKASPVSVEEDYSNLDLGISFSQTYTDLLKKHGAKNTELNHFCFDSQIENTFQDIKKDIDVSFSGTYNDHMFRQRTEYLLYLQKKLKLRYKVRYFFNIKSRRFFGLFPNIPLKLMPISRSPVFLNNYLHTIKRSKIVFNCHSDITGEDKGNMRIFEVLGMKSFLLTDFGKYPAHLVDGEDFVSYKDKKDLIDKINYFSKHEMERIQISEHGYATLKKYYDLDLGSKNLNDIFSKYL